MARLLCFTGSKGGSGKTVCAINCAFVLSEELNKKVLFVDANCPVSMQLAEYFPYDEELDHVDAKMLKDKAAELPIGQLHGIDHIRMFSSGTMRLDRSDITEAAIISKVLNVAISYEYVIFDLGAISSQRQLSILDFATDIILVTRGDAVSISRLNNDFELLKSLRYSSDSIRVLINDWSTDSPINQEWLDATFGLTAFGFVPLAPSGADQPIFPFIPEHSKRKQKSVLTRPFIEFALAMNEVKVDHSALFQYVTDAQKNNKEDKSDVAKEISSLTLRIQEEILDSLDLKHMQVSDDPVKLKELEIKVEEKAVNILDHRTKIRDRNLRQEIVRNTVNGVLYLGPLMDLLEDGNVSEIMVNRWDMIFIEQKGKLSLSSMQFFSESHLRRVIARIVSPIGRRVDVSSPMVDARLADGSRVNAIVPPLATKGSVLTIRKFDKEGLTIKDLIGFGTLNQQLVLFLEACVKSQLNVIISGGTGSGKTTLLNILSGFIPETERVITVEDSAELQLRQDHVITLEARPPNIEGEGEVTIRDLVRNALRMRPDRIVVGECRAGEALDMLQAMNTGHDGSMTTIHANSSKEMLSRIETLVMYAGTELPSTAIKQQISGAVDIVIQISRLKSGARKVLQISEVKGIIDGDVQVEDVFRYVQKGFDDEGNILGDFVSTGYVPECFDRFQENDIEIAKEMFWAS